MDSRLATLLLTKNEFGVYLFHRGPSWKHHFSQWAFQAFPPSPQTTPGRRVEIRRLRCPRHKFRCNLPNAVPPPTPSPGPLPEGSGAGAERGRGRGVEEGCNETHTQRNARRRYTFEHRPVEVRAPYSGTLMKSLVNTENTNSANHHISIQDVVAKIKYFCDFC